VTLNTVESGDVIIGNDTFSRGFNGKMSDFRVYSEALSILQINDILNESPTYPVAEFNSDVASIIEGSSVSFTDLSTGSPTSWSWSFPGGTPSSSTVQNPSVVYNTSGTYNVTLVVTNNDGQGTITKTGYITVTQPVGCTTILSDDFENGFGNWNDGGSDASTSSSGGNGNSASIKLRDGNGANSSIYTNALDLSALTEVTFNFSYYPVSMESNEDFFLEVSTNGGTTFATVQSWSSGTDFSNGVHYDESVVVSGPFATNTVFRMRCDASGKNDMVYIDDVTIQDCPTISSKTVGAKKDSVISINTELEANEVMPLIKLYPNPVSNTMVVKLKGENSLSGSVSVSIYTLSGKQIRTDDMFRLNDRIEINMSGLSQGVYMVAINASGKINYFKIVKN
jgi:PKD repeat protein